MFATPHTAIAMVVHVMLPTQPLLAYGTSIATHYAADYINEGGLSEEEQVQYDLFPLLICYLIAILTGNFKFFLRVNSSGNMLDIIDKKGYGNKIYPALEKYIPQLTNKIESTTRGQKFVKWWTTPTHYFHKQKPFWNPNPKTTKYVFGLGLGIALICTLIVLRVMGIYL